MLKPTLSLLFLLLVLLSGSASALANQCNVSKVIEKIISANDVASLKINVLAGYLDIHSSSADTIRFTGKACTDREIWLQQITLDVERIGDTVELTVVIPYNDREFDANYAYMDVDLSVPSTLPVSVKDSSGDIEIRGVSVNSVDDSSGNVRVTDNKSSLTIRDSSGDLQIRNLHGDLEISDSSGDIDIDTIEGKVLIPRDSSGGIDIETVSGIVSIGRDGSGDIDIDDVSANVEIGSDGSGGIKVRNIKGDVTIDSDGSGTVIVTDISRNLLIHAKGSGNIRTNHITGTISLPR